MQTRRILAALLIALPVTAAPSDVLLLEPVEAQGRHQLTLPNGSLARSTSSVIHDARLVSVEGGPAQVVLWSEGEDRVPFYRASIDGEVWSRPRETSYRIELQYAGFDPLEAPLDFSISGLEDTGSLHLVQLWSPLLRDHRARLASLGVTLERFVGAHTHLVRMDAELVATVRELGIVRWVGPYHPELRIEPHVLANLETGVLADDQRYHVQVFQRGPAQKAVVSAHVRALGGAVVAEIPDGFRLEAVLTPDMVRRVAALDEVLWIDRWSAPEEDMNIVRSQGGANYIESMGGFTGTGVRGEVMDGNCDSAHPDLQSNPVLFHGPHSGSASHGTPCTGVVFGDGTGSSSARGLLPDGQPIFADYGLLNNRYTHTAQLLGSPYFAVFQSNSWGGSLTSSYNSTSMEMDDILFLNDIVILQSQSNTGNTLSRPQPWAKNIVSVGGIDHQNSSNLGDDCWCGSGSTGPAEDGRVKPDLSFWYENIFTPADGGGYTQFSGTSAATPECAGYFGLLFELWHAGVFGNPTSSSVFESRPKATTARALMVNNAHSYPYSSDMSRMHQGWGLPDLRSVYDSRDQIFVVNEDLVLAELETTSFDATVSASADELRITLVYLDPAGTTSSSMHRINDLSLKATAPDGLTYYWGNNGLTSGNWSSSGGSSNEIDVIENVFIQDPQAGTWVVEVFADEVNADSHTETPELDVDFALVINGADEVGSTLCFAPSSYCVATSNSARIVESTQSA